MLAPRLGYTWNGNQLDTTAPDILIKAYFFKKGLWFT
jgi:hypothetical protein